MRCPICTSERVDNTFEPQVAQCRDCETKIYFGKDKCKNCEGTGIVRSSIIGKKFRICPKCDGKAKVEGTA